MNPTPIQELILSSAVRSAPLIKDGERAGGLAGLRIQDKDDRKDGQEGGLPIQECHGRGSGAGGPGKIRRIAR
jgi:hypothetical protein